MKFRMDIASPCITKTSCLDMVGEENEAEIPHDKLSPESTYIRTTNRQTSNRLSVSMMTPSKKLTQAVLLPNRDDFDEACMLWSSTFNDTPSFQ